MSERDFFASSQSTYREHRTQAGEWKRRFLGGRDEFEAPNITFGDEDKLPRDARMIVVLVGPSAQHLPSSTEIGVARGRRRHAYICKLPTDMVVEAGTRWKKRSTDPTSPWKTTGTIEFLVHQPEMVQICAPTKDLRELAFEGQFRSPDIGELQRIGFTSTEGPVNRAEGDPGPFAPSDQLVKFVERGIRSLEEAAGKIEANIVRGKPVFTPDRGELKEIVTVRLERMFATTAKWERHQGETFKAITHNGRFDLPIQFAVLDRLPIRPDEGGEFFATLYSEIVAYILAGGSLGGAWGDVVVRGDELYFNISPAPVRAAEEWEEPAGFEGDVYPEA